MKLKIIYEDNDMLVIEKPAGIAVHPSENKKRTSRTIVQLVSKHFPPIEQVGENTLRPGIVHRLDKETSGLMVIAKNNETFFELKKQFQERKVEKKYIALVSGVLEKESGIIDRPLVKMGARSRVENKGGSDPPLGVRPPRPALTKYKVIRRYADYTLVEVYPKTGRQHQIRVHFASINHPVACDKLYGRRAKKCPQGLSRHFLHASYLKFQLKNALMEFESKLPDDLAGALKML
jgi:23S rRNA pseudouridine1911/1915/1917 synthase